LGLHAESAIERPISQEVVSNVDLDALQTFDFKDDLGAWPNPEVSPLAILMSAQALRLTAEPDVSLEKNYVVPKCVH
jgi:hypothetical protein